MLIGLKLGGVITWSWWAVFAPVWIALLSILAFLLPLSGLALSFRIGEYLEDRRYRRQTARRRGSAPALRTPEISKDQPVDILDNFPVSLFPVKSLVRFRKGDPARLAHIGD